MGGTIIPYLKALNHHSYEYWSFRVKTYLLAEDLWDVVEGTKQPAKLEDGEPGFLAWRKINAKALHVITISCGEDAESFIGRTEMARDAWNTLTEKFRRPESSDSPVSEESDEIESNDDTGSEAPRDDSEIEAPRDEQAYSTFFNDVWSRDWEDIIEFIKQHPDAVRAKTNFSGMTPFHLVVYWGNVNRVKGLLPFVKRKDLKILDNRGHTALSLAIQNRDSDETTEIVKHIVEKNKKLLLRAVEPSTNAIPLMYALSSDKPKKASYLYSVTPVMKLKNKDHVELVSMSLRFKHLDVALHLLRKFPELVYAENNSGETPLNELACTRAGLFKDNASQLRMWKRWIYKAINIPPTPTPTPTLDDVSAPTHTRDDVRIDVQKEEKDQGNLKHLVLKVGTFFGGLLACLRQLSGFDDIYQMKLLHVRTFEVLHCICDELKKDYCMHQFVEKALFQAVERGHAPLIQRILRDIRASQWNEDYSVSSQRIFRDIYSSWFLAISNKHDKTLFQFAVEQRQDEIFHLIRYFDGRQRKDIVGRKDKFGNNMLHVVGKLPPLTQMAHIRGAPLQMQKELQWFKKVERMANPNDLNCINSDGRTPREEFTMHHRNLVEAAEKSMKETATSSSALVAALIITIMFAAAVTVPGGVNGDTGIPIYLHTKAFTIFIVADVVSLCSSTTSVMIFLGILTSRFAEEDFLTSLPTKLIIGFLTLFLSIGAMMIAFSSAIFITLPEKPLLVIPSVLLASVPIASFLWMQFPFLLEVITSTYPYFFLYLISPFLIPVALFFILIFFSIEAFDSLKRYRRRFC